MENTLSFNKAKYWTLPTISGIIFLVLGGLMLSEIAMSYKVIAVLFSVSFLISGSIEFFFARTNRLFIPGWRWMAASGAFSAILGIVLLVEPKIALTTLPLYIAFTVIFRSINGLSLAYELRSFGAISWINVMLLSIAGILLGVFLLWYPSITAISAVFIIGCALIYIALHLMYIGNVVRKAQKEVGFEVVAKTEEDEQDNIQKLNVDVNITNKKTGETETLNIISEDFTETQEGTTIETTVETNINESVDSNETDSGSKEEETK